MSFASDVPKPPLAVLTFGHSPVVLRRAVRADVPELVRLLADDPLGTWRELTDPCEDHELDPYIRAFEMIDADRRRASAL